MRRRLLARARGCFSSGEFIYNFSCFHFSARALVRDMLDDDRRIGIRWRARVSWPPGFGDQGTPWLHYVVWNVHVLDFLILHVRFSLPHMPVMCALLLRQARHYGKGQRNNVQKSHILASPKSSTYERQLCLPSFASYTRVRERRKVAAARWRYCPR